MKRQPDIQLLESGVWSRKTEDYWVGVRAPARRCCSPRSWGFRGRGDRRPDAVFDDQEHLLELATLKALGARPWELARFVLWLVAFLAAAGVITAFRRRSRSSRCC